jgi:hypothetical protein
MRSTAHPVASAIAAVALAAAFCFAGYWEFEQVDSGSIGSYVAIDKMSDGATWLAYVNRDSAIRLAHKDTVWEYEDLDTALVRPPFSFDIGSGDVIGVAGSGRLAERRDSGWSSEALPMTMSDVLLSYDPAGSPTLIFKDAARNGCLAVRTDSSWDTSVIYVPPGPAPLFSLTRACWRQHGNCAFLVDVSWGDLIQQYSVALGRRDSGIWTWHGLAGGLDGGGYVFAALPDASDSIHTLWAAADNYHTNKLVCDAHTLDGITPWAAACLDDSGRVQCVWGRDGKLKFSLVPEPTLEVGPVSGLSWYDITTDALSQPVIAYCLDDGSIRVVHGNDVAGLSSEPHGAAVRVSDPEASIVRGVLVLGGLGTRSGLSANPVMSRAVLLDISGRRVMDLQPGGNDISRVAPGVYFLREAQAQAQAVRKIVIAR